MYELTLEALGYRPDEARATRRTFDLTHTPEQRASAQRAILDNHLDTSRDREHPAFTLQPATGRAA